MEGQAAASILQRAALTDVSRASLVYLQLEPPRPRFPAIMDSGGDIFRVTRAVCLVRLFASGPRRAVRVARDATRVRVESARFSSANFAQLALV